MSISGLAARPVAEAFRKLVGDYLKKTAVAYVGELEVSTEGVDWLSFRHAAHWLAN